MCLALLNQELWLSRSEVKPPSCRVSPNYLCPPSTVQHHLVTRLKVTHKVQHNLIQRYSLGLQSTMSDPNAIFNQIDWPFGWRSASRQLCTANVIQCTDTRELCCAVVQWGCHFLAWEHRREHTKFIGSPFWLLPWWFSMNSVTKYL